MYREVRIDETESSVLGVIPNPDKIDVTTHPYVDPDSVSVFNSDYFVVQNYPVVNDSVFRFHSQSRPTVPF